MVKATFKISKVLTCCLVKSRVSPIAERKGAWLNQTKKVRKKAIHPKCRILFLPAKDKTLSLSFVGGTGVADDILASFYEINCLCLQIKTDLFTLS